MAKTLGQKQNYGHQKYTIAMLGTNLYFENPIKIFEAVRNYLHTIDCNLLYFSGEAFQTPFSFDQQANIQYQFINEKIADGLIIVSNLLNSFISKAQFRDICMGYLPLPMVSLGAPIDGIPSIIPDNYSGMYQLVSHLIETHHLTRIAFVKGIAHHADAEERFSSYSQALKDHDIQIDGQLIFQGNFQRSSGMMSITELIDKRKMKPGRDFNAVVCANDYMASGAILELQQRGINVPEDMVVVGFDGGFFAKCMIPSLTTVEYPYNDIAIKAVNTLIDVIEQKIVNKIIQVQTSAVVNTSCGCVSDSQLIMSAHEPEKAVDFKDSTKSQFYNFINEKILNCARPTLLIWEKALNGLQNNAKWRLLSQKSSKKDEVWKILGELATQTFNDANYQAITFNLGNSINSTLDMNELLEIIKNSLPLAQIKSFYLCLFENPGKTTKKLPKKSRLILAVHDEKQYALPKNGLAFPSNHLIPEEVLSNFGHRSWVVLSLFFHKQQLGYLLLDSDSPHENLHFNLRNQISSALMGVRLLNETRQANEKIKNFNERLKDENLRIKAEMDVARDLQMSLLPQDIQRIHNDFQISTFILPADEVGGDYFDTFLDDNGILWFGIGDVSGHGLKPGLIMMMVQTIHVALTTISGNSPKDALVTINRVMRKNVYKRMKENNYMTCTLFKYLGEGNFLFAGAHLDLLIFRMATKKCERVETSGVWLNVIDDISKMTENLSLKMELSDILILYTDGITEINDKQGKMLNVEGLMQLINKHYQKSLEQMKKNITNEIFFLNSGVNKDDMTLVFIQRIN